MTLHKFQPKEVPKNDTSWEFYFLNILKIFVIKKSEKIGSYSFMLYNLNFLSDHLDVIFVQFDIKAEIKAETKFIFSSLMFFV